MFAEDLSTYFDTSSGFARQATLDGAALVGIFDATPAEFDVVAGMAPIFVLASASVPTDPRGLVLVVDGASYTVRDYSHDGTGVCTLRLEVV